MKLVIVCDDLIQQGGQEKLVLSLLELWPDAYLYSSVISNDYKQMLGKMGIKYSSSFINKLPFAIKFKRLYSAILLDAIAFKSFNFDTFDLVLCVSSRYAHWINVKPNVKQIWYINSPGRMWWNQFSYFENEPMGIFKVLIAPLMHILRLVDFYYSQQSAHIFSNSTQVQKRVKKFWNRESKVIYPFFENPSLRDLPTASDKKDYYILISRLVAWKKIDVAVKAFNKLGYTLKIIGEGSDEKRLKNMALHNVEFLGYVGEKKKYSLLAGARALIQTQQEDFGIVPLEAMAVGCPVIAFGKGGVLETVVDGTFFNTQDEISLIEAVHTFEKKTVNTPLLVERAQYFSKQKFLLRIKDEVGKVLV